MFFAGKSAYDGLEELHVWKIWERKAGAWKRGKYEGRKRKEEVEIEGWEACVWKDQEEKVGIWKCERRKLEDRGTRMGERVV